MEPNKFQELQIAIIKDPNMHSMADLFNKATDEYLKKQKRGAKNEKN